MLEKAVSADLQRIIDSDRQKSAAMFLTNILDQGEALPSRQRYPELFELAEKRLEASTKSKLHETLRSETKL